MDEFALKTLGEPILRQHCKRVSQIGDRERRLAKKLEELAQKHEGVGLAAPQIGGKQRMVVVRPDLESRPQLLINPEIQEREGPKICQKEGCLSIPGMEVEVARHQGVRLEYQTLDQTPRQMEAEGFLARVIQHELDHLEGKLIVDHLSPLKRRMKVDQWRKQMARRKQGGGQPARA